MEIECVQILLVKSPVDGKLISDMSQGLLGFHADDGDDDDRRVRYYLMYREVEGVFKVIEYNLSIMCESMEHILYTVPYPRPQFTQTRRNVLFF